MSILQREKPATAFRSRSASYAVPAQEALPRRREPLAPHPSPSQRRPAERVSGVQSRQRDQNMAMMMMIMTAMLIVTIGLAYLSGYARLTQEGYHRAKLQGMLRQERELAQQWRQRQAIITAPVSIEHMAISVGMVPCDDQKTVTVTRVGSLQQ